MLDVSLGGPRHPRTSSRAEHPAPTCGSHWMMGVDATAQTPTVSRLFLTWHVSAANRLIAVRVSIALQVEPHCRFYPVQDEPHLRSLEQKLHHVRVHRHQDELLEVLDE